MEAPALVAGRGDRVALPTDRFKSFSFKGEVAAFSSVRRVAEVTVLVVDKVDEVPFGFGLAVTDKVVGFGAALN